MAIAHPDQNTPDQSVGGINAALSNDRRFLRRKTPPTHSQSPSATQVVDLFCGCGGLTYGALEGLKRTGKQGRLALAIDLDPLPLEVMRKTLALSSQQIKTWDLTRLKDARSDTNSKESAAIARVADNSLLLAGPPCQGHSALNNHTRHNDPRNDLYMAVARAAELIRPLAVISENVGGVSSDKKKAAHRCVTALRATGYRVVEKRLDLSTLGVPQRRIRHVIVATKGRPFDWTAVATLPTRDLAWAIADLIDADEPTLFDTPSQASTENRERINWLFDRDAYDLPDDLRPACHRDGNHSYMSMYGRLHWNQPAQTITRGFGSMGQGRFVHPLRRRTLTPHEAARLQCLPDYVAFNALALTRTALATMIGNVAPPLLATRIVEALVAQRLL